MNVFLDIESLFVWGFCDGSVLPGEAPSCDSVCQQVTATSDFGHIENTGVSEQGRPPLLLLQLRMGLALVKGQKHIHHPHCEDCKNFWPGRRRARSLHR